MFYSLTLVECLVKNCGTRLHAAVNNDVFMKEMMKVARKYNAPGMHGPENAEVAELSLDIIQMWGEAFLPYKKNFQNIVSAYQDLRKENLPFKAQYDSSRVPIFIPANGMPQASRGHPVQRSGSVYASDSEDMDAILAAALQASMLESSGASPTTSVDVSADGARFQQEDFMTDEEIAIATAGAARAARHGSHSHQHQQPQRPRQSVSGVKSKKESLEELKGSMEAAIGLMVDMISAAVSVDEVTSDELAVDMFKQIQSLQSSMGSSIEAALTEAPDVCHFDVVIIIITSCFMCRAWRPSLKSMMMPVRSSMLSRR